MPRADCGSDFLGYMAEIQGAQIPLTSLFHLIAVHYLFLITVIYINTQNLIMKSKFEITIEQEILDQMKQYAARQKRSISEIVEDYFRLLTALKRTRALWR